MEKYTEDYYWDDWAFFIKMQIDWLSNAAKNHKRIGVTGRREEIANQLQEAADDLEDIYERLDGTFREEEIGAINQELKDFYCKMVDNLRNWWD